MNFLLEGTYYNIDMDDSLPFSEKVRNTECVCDPRINENSFPLPSKKKTGIARVNIQVPRQRFDYQELKISGINFSGINEAFLFAAQHPDVQMTESILILGAVSFVYGKTTCPMLSCSSLGRTIDIYDLSGGVYKCHRVMVNSPRR